MATLVDSLVRERKGCSGSGKEKLLRSGRQLELPASQSLPFTLPNGRERHFRPLWLGSFSFCLCLLRPPFRFRLLIFFSIDLRGHERDLGIGEKAAATNEFRLERGRNLDRLTCAFGDLISHHRPSFWPTFEVMT